MGERGPESIPDPLPAEAALDAHATQRLDSVVAPPAGAAGPDARQWIPGYQILGEIHHGGQGFVFKAVQKSTKRVVAVKVLTGGNRAGEAARRRFEREIDLAASLRHANIVTVFDSGITQDRYYYAMEYISGVPLDQYVSTHALDRRATLELFRKVCEAIDYAHRHGVIHRDLKPGNILVDADGEPHVLDFGLAKAAGANVLSDGFPVTVSNEFIGTLAYASPEQVRGDASRIDTRSDVYALGVVLYRLFTGKHPHKLEGDFKEVFAEITEGVPERPSKVRADVAADLETVILRAMAKDPARRYQSASEFIDDIECLLSGEPISAKRDSLTYLLSWRGRRLARRNRILTCIAAAALTIALAVYGGTELMYKWTEPNRTFERLAMTGTGSTGPIAELEDVRLITFDDTARLEQLAATEGLEGVSIEQGGQVSFRRLHGRLMEKLAVSGAACVVWDVMFRQRSEFDESFVAGARALRETGIPVVVPVPDWERDASGMPALSPVIAPAVRWGTAAADLSGRTAWRVHVVHQRKSEEARMSLSLAALAASRHPESEVDIVLELDTEALELRYWRRHPEVPQARQWLGSAERVPLSRLRLEPEAIENQGIEAGDIVGHLVLDLPANEVFDAGTVKYEDVFSAPPADLRTWFSGRTVVIGNFLPGVDRHMTPDGRELGGCHAQLVAINALLQSKIIRLARAREISAILLLCVFGGAAVYLSLRNRRVAMGAVISASILMLIAASVVAYRVNGYLCPPVAPALALLLGATMAAVVRHVVRQV